MIVELHLLQNFAPSNLNRDETGAPKSAIFGGYPRARVSSQSSKRATRKFVERRVVKGTLRDAEGRLLLKLTDLGDRSKGFGAELVKRFVKAGKDAADAQHVVETLFGCVSLQAETDVLYFLGKSHINRIQEVCETHWAEIAEFGEASKQEATFKKENKKKPLPSELKDRLELAKKGFKQPAEEMDKILASKDIADIAMFGRMIAAAAKYNIDAACQVAHPISTHIVGEVEIDYFTAMDDLQPKEKPGASHVDTADFNSACYYRYANVSIEQLVENLEHGGQPMARNTLEAFLRGFIEAIPTGKQNTFASPTETSLALIIVREAGTLSLANAFAKPVQPKDGEGLIELSIEALDEHFGALRKLYGEWAGITKVAVCTTRPNYLHTFQENECVDSLPELVRRAVEAAFPQETQEEKSS